MIKRIFISLLFLIISYEIKASHADGGEIVWKCQANGKYRFILRITRACEGIQLSPLSFNINVYNHPSITSIQVDKVSFKEISIPGCSGPGAINCVNNYLGAYEQHIYEATDVDLGNYAPPTKGWWFVFVLLARSNALINIPGEVTAMTLRTAMFPIRIDNSKSFPPFSLSHTIHNIDNNILKAKDCRISYKNSPDFLESPIFSPPQGQLIQINPGLIDIDNDSLSSAWAKPMGSEPQVSNFIPNSPIYTSIPTGLIHPENSWLEPPYIPIGSSSLALYPQYLDHFTPFAYTNPLGSSSVAPLDFLNTETGEMNFLVPSGNLSIPSISKYNICIRYASYVNGNMNCAIFRDYIVSPRPFSYNKSPSLKRVLAVVFQLT